MTARSLPPTGAHTPHLRNLYFFRVAFSALWVLLVSSVTSPSSSGSAVSGLAGLLLVLYPISDFVATIVDLRTAATGRSKLAQRINAATGAAAALAIAISATVSLTSAMDVFAGWAIVSGVLQLTVGVARLGELRGQWLMIISGAGSIFAGTTFVDWSGSPSAALHALTQYSIGGAVWYLLTVLWLLRPREPGPSAVSTNPNRRRAAPASSGTPEGARR